MQQKLVAAQSALHSAPPGQLDAALEELADATVLAGSAQALTETAAHIAMTRLQHAVYDQRDGWEREAVELFNSAVSEFQLNEVAADLPQLESLVSPLDLNRAQSHALHQWSEAAGPLRTVWSFYQKLAQLGGDDVGPGGADELSTNLTLAARLGSPGSFATAQSAASRLTSIAVGSDAARRYSKIGIFAVPAMSGYALNLTTSEGAAHRRRAIQPAAAAAR
jgi:hypothetical protein